MLRELASGTFGVRLRPPSLWSVVHDGPHEAQLMDEENASMWWLFFFADMHLDMGAQEEIDDVTALAHHYARMIFDDAFRTEHHADDQKPRTADAAWSPLIEVKRSSLGSSAALRTIHRMFYEPGRELVMGHFMVPLASGLFEARVISPGRVRTTGYRESVLFLSSGVTGFLPQPVLDAEEHDAKFPDHPLSLVRKGLDALAASADIEVLEPAPTTARAPVELRALQCSLLPPARFRLSAVEETTAVFQRVAFCGTDGVEALIVERVGEVAADINLVDEATWRARALHEQQLVQDIHVHAEALDAHIEGVAASALLIVDGRGHQNARRSVMRWFLDDTRTLWHFSISSAAAVPAAMHAASLADVAASWRRMPKGLFEKLWRR